MTEDRVAPSAPVQREDREALLGQYGHVLWFTGLSGSGKTTLVCAVEAEIHRRGVLTARVDGDVVRDGLNCDLGFSREDRAENIRRVTELSRVLTLSGLIVLVAAISPYEADRESARMRIGKERFSLIHVATALDICEARDPKGLYKKARDGQIPEFTGISAPYEIPKRPELVVQTTESLECSVADVMAQLDGAGILGRKGRSA